MGFKALSLGLKNASELGCRHLHVFREFELVINMIKKIYRPSKKILQRYIQVINHLMEGFISFNLTYIHRELNMVLDKLLMFTSSPSQPQSNNKPSCDVISLYRPLFPKMMNHEIFLRMMIICFSLLTIKEMECFLLLE